jgi:hypothetical protein
MRLAWGGGGLDSTGSGQGPVAGYCECGDEPSSSCATELVSSVVQIVLYFVVVSTSIIRVMDQQGFDSENVK